MKMSVRSRRTPSTRRNRNSQHFPFDKIVLEKVLGVSVESNSSLALDTNSGLIAYSAGFVVICYSTKRSKQQLFLHNSALKAITCLDFSKDGKFIVTGESGHQPMVRIWNVEERSMIAEFSGHNFRITNVVFSSSGRYVVSVGSQEDGNIIVWDRSTNTKFASSKITSKVNAIAFSENNQFFVTVGIRHVRFWYLDINRPKSKETVPLQGRNALLGDFMQNNFTDVGICVGRVSSSGQMFTYVVSQAGQLLQFNEQRYLDKWVDLKTGGANCLSVCESVIVVGCSSGIVRLFDTTTLHYFTTLPLPHSLGIDLLNPMDETADSTYPDVIATKYDYIHSRVTCFYNDHSFYVWDIRDISHIQKISSHLYHSGSIWSLDTSPLNPLVPTQCPSGDSLLTCPLPANSFVTCADDETIRVWCLSNSAMNYHSVCDEMEDVRERLSNSISQDLIKIIYLDSQQTFLCPADKEFTSDPANESKHGFRTIHISPDGQQMAVGDKEGNLRVYTLDTFDQICSIEAHDGEILSVHYFQSHTVPELMLLCTASRDRLIHIFDARQGFSLVQTLDDHSGTIFAVRLVETPDNEVMLVSCGMDKSLLFRVLEPDDKGESARFYLKHHLVGKHSQQDLCLTPGRRYAVVGCQDRQIRIYNLLSGKQRRSYKGTISEDGPLLRCAIDPTGTYLATAGADKQICILHFLTGEIEACFVGHSEQVTSLRFLPNLRHLISVGADGCIMVWRLTPAMTMHMRHKQAHLESSQISSGHHLLSNSGGMLSSEDYAGRASGWSPPVTTCQQSITVSLKNKNSPAGDQSGRAAPGFKFSVSVLPAWAQKKLNEDTSQTDSDQIELSMLSQSTWAARLPPSDSGELQAPVYFQQSCSPSTEPDSRQSTILRCPPRVVNDDDDDNFEEGEDEEFSQAFSDKKCHSEEEFCDLDSLQTTSTGDDEEDSGPLAPVLPILEQVKLQRRRSNSNNAQTEFRLNDPHSKMEDSLEVCDYPVITGPSLMTRRSGPYGGSTQSVRHTPAERMNSSFDQMSSSMTSASGEKTKRKVVPPFSLNLASGVSPNSSVSMPATPIDRMQFEEDEGENTEDSLEGDDNASISSHDSGHHDDPSKSISFDDPMAGAGETLAYLSALEEVLDKHGAIEDPRQSLSARFLNKKQPSLVHSLAGNARSRKHTSVMQTSARSHSRERSLESPAKKPQSKRNTTRMTNSTTTGSSYSRNKAPVETSYPGPPSVRTRTSTSRKPITESTYSQPDRKKSDITPANKPATRTNKRGGSSTTRIGARPAVSSEPTNRRSATRPTARPNLRTVSTDRASIGSKHSDDDKTLVRKSALKPANSMNSVSSNEGKLSSANQKAATIDRNNQKTDSNRRPVKIENRTRWDQSSKLRQKRESRKTCPILDSDLSAARSRLVAEKENNEQTAPTWDLSETGRGHIEGGKKNVMTSSFTMGEHSSGSKLSSHKKDVMSTSLTGRKLSSDTNNNSNSPADSHILVKKAAAFIHHKEENLHTRSKSDLSNMDTVSSSSSGEKFPTTGGGGGNKWSCITTTTYSAWLSDKEKSNQDSKPVQEISTKKEHVIDDEEDNPINGSTTTITSSIGSTNNLTPSKPRAFINRPPVDVESIISGILSGRHGGGSSSRGSMMSLQSSSTGVNNWKSLKSPEKKIQDSPQIERPSYSPFSQRPKLYSYQIGIDDSSELELTEEATRPDTFSPDTLATSPPSSMQQSTDDFHNFSYQETKIDDEDTDDGPNSSDETGSRSVSLDTALSALREAVETAILSCDYANQQELSSAKDLLQSMEPDLAKLRVKCDLPAVYVEPVVAEMILRDFGERLCSHFERSLRST